MEIIYNKIFLEHDTGNHPESRRRLECFGKLPETKIENGRKYLPLIHSQEYIKMVKDLSEQGGFLDMDTIASKKTFEVACYAVGAGIEASEQEGFALVRPPGHHASSKRGGGFCFFNNIAIAVKKLAEKGKKVFILDFDSHFGDGTSYIFLESDRVFYSSIHQYPAYPNEGWIDEIGKKRGKGFQANIPVPPQASDDIFKDAVQRLLGLAEQFQADVIAVSAGFDGHHAEHLLNLNYSSSGYYQAGRMVSDKFKHVFAVLEGGYNLDYLARNVRNFIAGINRQNPFFKEKETKSPSQTRKEYLKRIEGLTKNLSPYWKLK